MKRDIARMQTLIPASEKDRLATHLFAVQQLEASLRQTYGMMPTTGVCTKPATPPTYANTSSGQMTSSTRVHDRVRRRLLRVRLAQQPPPPGPRPQSAPADQDGVRVRPGSRRDVHVVVGDQLGRVSRQLPGRVDQRAIRSRRRTTRPATAIRRATPATRDWLNQISQFYSAATATVAAGVRDHARHRRQHADRQHRRRLPDRGGARLGPQPAEHAAHHLRREEHAREGRDVS